MDWLEEAKFGEIEHYQAPLLTDLDDLRINRPIIWDLLTSPRNQTSSRAIAKRLAWPHDIVLGILRDYKKERKVFDAQGTTDVVWEIDWQECPSWWELRSFVMESRRRGGLSNPPPKESDH